MDSALQTFSSCFSWFYSYPYISSFEWKRNLTFASSPLFLLCVVCSYLLCTLFLSLLLSNRRHPIPLGLLPVLHNFILFSSSLIMFVGCTMATLSELGRLPAVTSSFTVLDASYTKRLSWNWVFCFPTGTRASGPVFFWSYVFYLSKFYELLDTFIVILKRRKLTFLHVFHHAIVIVMSFFWLEYVQSLQVIALLTNTSVHMLMYSYYLMSSLGFKPFWKKIVTNCQIVQFMFSFAVSFFMLYLHFNGTGCQGFWAWTFNAFFNASLLVLFVNFHRKQYRQRRSENQLHSTKRD